jgi:hypothetical protein
METLLRQKDCKSTTFLQNNKKSRKNLTKKGPKTGERNYLASVKIVLNNKFMLITVKTHE